MHQRILQVPDHVTTGNAADWFARVNCICIRCHRQTKSLTTRSP